MGIIKSFKNFKLNETAEFDSDPSIPEYKITDSSESGDVELFRVVGVPNGEDLVVDTKNPGKYYFRNEKDIDPSVLKEKGDEYHVINITTDASNIDEELSEVESEKHGCDCVVLKDDSKAKINGIIPLD